VPPHGLLPARAFPLAVERAAVNELCDGAYKPRVQSYAGEPSARPSGDLPPTAVFLSRAAATRRRQGGIRVRFPILSLLGLGFRDCSLPI
jgi:hypothetical protein